MHRLRIYRRSGPLGAAFVLPSLLAFASLAPDRAKSSAKIDFSRDIQPILANNCLECHGSDPRDRKAGLRLDTFAGATMRAVVPGSSAKSPLVGRITADESSRMPPASSGKRLTSAQVELIKNWIDQGARYAQHWAFVPPVRPALPRVRYTSWPKNPIDYFVLARLEREALKPSPEADKATLLRRVSLDLTGLPPTPREVRDFLKDTRPDAYERVVDRLLASPHYGERWARRWLDVARYADTNGYEKDRDRSIWPYRDWVINAFNADMPFDQFTIEQLAGDLLPNATQDQIIATGFHRNTMANEEGGIDLAEDRFKSMVDRVNTTGEAWLGLTVMCGQCHSHKYDPISQREYYGLFAFLNNTDEVETNVVSPEIKARREQIQKQIDDLGMHAAGHFSGGPPALAQKLGEWEKKNGPLAARWQVGRVAEARSANFATMTTQPDGSVLLSGDTPNTDTYEVTIRTRLPKITALRLEVLSDPSLPSGGPGRAHFFQRGGFLLSEVAVEAKPNGMADYKPVKLVAPSADFEAPGRAIGQTLDGKLDTGWMISGQEGKDHRAVFPFAEPVKCPAGGTLRVRMDQFFVHQCVIGRFRLSVTDQPLPPKAAPFPADVEAALSDATLPADKRSRALQDWFLRTSPEMEPLNREIAGLRAQMPAYPTTMVLRERPFGWERVTYRHERGEYLKPMEPVEPVTPKVLPAFPADWPKNRLGLAKWLVSAENPLTARVAMNRDWQAFFGHGIVGTLEDFGTRGDRPTHPQLLDWLATEFMHPSPAGGRGAGGDGAWSMKRMHRLIVTSATYRQSACVTPDLVARDPGNLLLARGPRFRVDAEMVRDIALSAAGLLNPKIGGPSVYPPQPAEVTAQVYGGYAYPTSQGADKYRRGLYTFWKRTAPFASFLTFDAPTSETTCLRRVRSNTPLQALTLMNDEVYMDAAEALAGRVCGEGGSTPQSRVEYLYLCVLNRLPRPAESAKILAFLRKQQARFASDPAAAKAVARQYRPSDWHPASASDAELAAWTLTARAILNLDEAITKQ